MPSRRPGTIGSALAVLAAVVAAAVALDTLPEADRPSTKTVAPESVATAGAYVALGDSYSAGVGLAIAEADAVPDDGCHRSSAAFYHTVAKSFRFPGGTSLWACSGATVPDLLHGKDGRPPQVGRVGAGTSLVTVSVGGNDVGFTKVLTRCMVEPLMGGCRHQGGQIADRLATLRRTLPTLLSAVTARAPSARVLVVGYPRMFAPSPKDDVATMGRDDQRWLNERGGELDAVLRRSAADADRALRAAGRKGSVEYVDAFDAFAGHELGTPRPYVNGLKFKLLDMAAELRSFHPNAAGYRRLADLVIRQVRTGPGRPFKRAR
ncbi:MULTISPECIES: SGNH/GDSL hydrolase family protein [Actinomadura]|uniref:SGNH/GDSL hydrolase family protein n=1 Tax=Actinomadura TaxID=1988 RepID=UPI00262735F2|nr:SGNH/GDSL hydrolase family protein [Actinomadura geliboluensis]